MPASDTQPLGNESYFRQLCEYAGVALISTDADLTIRSWNVAAARTFGAAADRMLGTPIMSVLRQERRRLVEQTLRRAIRTGEIGEFEFQQRDERGALRELAATAAPIVSESGARIGATLCIRDITRFVAHQAERYESRKLAALSQMAGMIAHHFNNIVGGVITSIDFANASDDPVLKSRVLQQTGGALTRVTSLVNGLLIFAEGDQHSGDLADFTEIFNQCADYVERSIADGNIKLIVNLPTLPILPVPRAQMSTVLHNITQNAIDAMPQGGVLQIDVKLEEAQIVTEITDTGVGLEESIVPRIFEPFWTTKNRASARSGAATGLGLAVAHGILQVMGGSIHVKSQPGKGSSFAVAIPRPQTGEQSQTTDSGF